MPERKRTMEDKIDTILEYSEFPSISDAGKTVDDLTRILDSGGASIFDERGTRLEWSPINTVPMHAAWTRLCIRGERGRYTIWHCRHPEFALRDNLDAVLTKVSRVKWGAS